MLRNMSALLISVVLSFGSVKIMSVSLVVVLNDSLISIIVTNSYKFSGASRIFPRGAPTSLMGVLTYLLFRKLHED